MKGKSFPVMNSDEEAERFVAEADLSEYDWSGAKRMQLIFTDEDGAELATVTLDPTDSASAAKQAHAKGVPVGEYLSGLLHDAISREAA